MERAEDCLHFSHACSGSGSASRSSSGRSPSLSLSLSALETIQNYMASLSTMKAELVVQTALAFLGSELSIRSKQARDRVGFIFGSGESQ